MRMAESHVIVNIIICVRILCLPIKEQSFYSFVAATRLE